MAQENTFRNTIMIIAGIVLIAGFMIFQFMKRKRSMETEYKDRKAKDEERVKRRDEEWALRSEDETKTKVEDELRRLIDEERARTDET